MNKIQEDRIIYYKKVLENIMNCEKADYAYNEIVKYIRNLRTEVDENDLQNCILYHILIGSTIRPNPKLFEDLKGKNSIALFILELEKKYVGNKSFL